VERVAIDELVAELDRSAAGILRVRLSGRSVGPEAGKQLGPLFDRMLALGRDEGRVLVLNFEKLEYFNSSTVAALVQFIRATQEAGLGLTVVYDGRQRWQALSFDALRRALRPAPGGHAPSVHFSEA
jgi:hypothetical protein